MCVCMTFTFENYKQLKLKMILNHRGNSYCVFEGLDATTTEIIMQVMKVLSRKNISVISVIHQPRNVRCSLIRIFKIRWKEITSRKKRTERGKPNDERS